MEGWRQAYPAVALTGEIERAKQWLMANPAKRKQNIFRFLTNWLSKAQEKGGKHAFCIQHSTSTTLKQNLQARYKMLNSGPGLRSEYVSQSVTR